MTQVCAVSLLLTSSWLLGCQSEAGAARPPGSAIAGAAGSTGTAGASAGSGSDIGGAVATAGVAGQSAGEAGVPSGAGGGGGAPGGGGIGAGAGSGGADAGGGGAGGLAPLEECSASPSIDRLTQWIASGEGETEPKTGSILVEEGERYVAQVHFVGSDWHVIPVYVANKYGDTADLSASQGITLTYSATAELHVQLRSGTKWSGGAQYATTIPSTGGQTQTRFFSFAEQNWQSLFDPPELSWPDTLKQAMGLVFVGNRENVVVFQGLRIDGWTPPCP